MNLKEMRENLELSQTEAAKLFGTHQTTISKWERGIREVDPLYIAWLEAQNPLVPKDKEILEQMYVREYKRAERLQKLVNDLCKDLTTLENNYIKALDDKTELDHKYKRLLDENAKLMLLRQRDESLIVELKGKDERKWWQVWK